MHYLLGYESCWWRANVVKDLNRIGGFSRSLANSATDWPCLLLELLSSATETDYFQPGCSSELTGVETTEAQLIQIKEKAW
ncbi:hypothetical protein ACSBR2_038546 [Camellia fascicularis]